MTDNYTGILDAPLAMLAAFELAGNPTPTLVQKVLSGRVALSTITADPVSGSTGRVAVGSTATIGAGATGTISL